jgi:hypothetical protein
MITFALRRYALSVGATFALLTGCGGSQPPIGAPGATQQTPDTKKRLKTFEFMGAPQSFVVPTGVTVIAITASGASGPSGGTTTHGSGEYLGGNGGLVEAVIPVSAGEKLYVVVGGEGGAPSGFYGGTGGFNGGGDGGGGAFQGEGGTGGGGASDVRVRYSGASDRILVAGGGGGGGLDGGYGAGSGGDGGGKIGAAGGPSTCGPDNPDGCGGNGGTQRHGGRGGAGGQRSGYTHGAHGDKGTYGLGGIGGDGAYSGSLGGGGGGGGWYGGGGAGAGSGTTSGNGGGGGGGGGSSYVEPTATLLESSQGAAPAGNGKVIFSWSTGKQ